MVFICLALLAGDSPLSQEYYSHAFEVGDAFVEQFHTDRIYRVQYLTLKGLGENAVSKKDYAAAERPYLDAMSRCMNFAEVINEPFAWRDLGDICQGLGFVYDKLENSKGSKTFYSIGAVAYENVVKKVGNVRMIRNLINCHMRLGSYIL